MFNHVDLNLVPLDREHIDGVRYYKIPDDQPRPRVTAGDDAARVLWHPIKDLDGSVIFSDHYFIIQKLLT